MDDKNKRAGLIRLTTGTVFRPDGEQKRFRETGHIWVRPKAIDVVTSVTYSTDPEAPVICSLVETGPGDDNQHLVKQLPDEVLTLMEDTGKGDGDGD